MLFITIFHPPHVISGVVLNHLHPVIIIILKLIFIILPSWFLGNPAMWQRLLLFSSLNFAPAIRIFSAFKHGLTCIAWLIIRPKYFGEVLSRFDLKAQTSYLSYDIARYIHESTDTSHPYTWFFVSHLCTAPSLSKFASRMSGNVQYTYH